MNWSNLPDLLIPQPEDINLFRVQRNWLMHCLARNRDTNYGQLYHFSTISSVVDYQRKVPIVDYEELTPWINLMAEGQQDVLFSGRTIAFEQTSGSTSAQKLIPYSAQSLEDFRRALLPWLASLPDLYAISSGHAYWALSPATRSPQQTSGGIPIGLPDSAYLGDKLTEFFLQVSAVPFWVTEIGDFDLWQLITLYFLVRCPDLSLISIWSPTFLLSLLDALDERRNQLEQALCNGLRVRQKLLAADPQAWQRLLQFYANPNPKVLWPNLKLISCWADASSRSYVACLKSRFEDIPIQPKGLLSTEAVITVPDPQGFAVLTPQAGFYEFIDGIGQIFLADALQTGQTYQVILTTAGGLYRYRTHDLVRCQGYTGSLPILQFVGREQTADLAGEKLSEAFVGECLEDIHGFCMLLVLSANPGYCLVLETSKEEALSLRDQVEQKLSRNPHYAHARKLGQLQPLKLLVMDNPARLYLDRALQHGRRLGDVKLPILCFDTDLFNDYLDQVA